MRLVFTLLAFLLMSQLSAQSAERVETAFRTADTELLGSYLPATVDIEICSKGGVLSRGQAQMMLDHFFKSSRIQALVVMHASQVVQKKQHVIAEYHTLKGNYTLIYKLEERNEQLSIRQIRIEKAR